MINFGDRCDPNPDRRIGTRPARLGRPPTKPRSGYGDEMPRWSGLLLTVALLAAVHTLRRVEAPAAQLATGPAAAALILLVARCSARSWTEVGLTTRGAGWAAGAVSLTALVYAAALAIPATRRLFRDPRYLQGLRPALVTALISVPLATVAV